MRYRYRSIVGASLFKGLMIMTYYQIKHTNSVFEDRRVELDRRALLNFDQVCSDDQRNYRDRRNWRNQFQKHEEWWLYVNYVDKDFFFEDKSSPVILVKNPDQ